MTPADVAVLATVVGSTILFGGATVLALAWATAAAQLGALAFGRYAPYAGGVEPPPRGVVRTSLSRVFARRRRRAYARSR